MDISFDVNNNEKFSFRVAIIIYCNNKILLEKSDKNDYWNLIGGRVKLEETTLYAIIREVDEEVGIVLDKKNLKLNNVSENFFTYDGTYFHELLFNYQIELDNDVLVEQQDFGSLDKKGVTHHWFNIEEIEKINIKPYYEKNFINNRTDNIKHYVIKNDEII